MMHAFISAKFILLTCNVLSHLSFSLQALIASYRQREPGTETGIIQVHLYCSGIMPKYNHSPCGVYERRCFTKQEHYVLQWSVTLVSLQSHTLLAVPSLSSQPSSATHTSQSDTVVPSPTSFQSIQELQFQLCAAHSLSPSPTDTQPMLVD